MSRTLSSERIKVSKIDAAKRQLRTAILLWFLDEDPVSIHTLTAAAHEIIHRLFRQKGLSDLFFDSRQFKKEKQGEINKQTKKIAAFFKHADSMPEPDIDFAPDLNIALIMIILDGLARMDEPLSKIEDGFRLWYWLHYPGMLHEDIVAKLLPVDEIAWMRSLKKREFIEGFIKRKI